MWAGPGEPGGLAALGGTQPPALRSERAMRVMPGRHLLGLAEAERFSRQRGRETETPEGGRCGQKTGRCLRAERPPGGEQARRVLSCCRP